MKNFLSYNLLHLFNQTDVRLNKCKPEASHRRTEEIIYNQQFCKNFRETKTYNFRKIVKVRSTTTLVVGIYIGLLFIILIQIALADSLLLNKKINYFLNKNPELKKVQIGVLVKSGGKTIYAKKENLSFIPASNLKIITSACAFFFLGRNFKYQTKLLSSPIDPVFKTIKGNLILKGEGDPTFKKENLKEFAEKLKNLGIKEIQGDLIADDSLFDQELIPLGWKENYLLEEYAPETSALSLDENILKIKINSFKITINPYSALIKIKKNYKTSNIDTLEIKRKLLSNEIILSGTIPKGEIIETAITIHNPPLIAISILAQNLKEAGIKIKGKIRKIYPYEELIINKPYIVIASRASPPLIKLLEEVNKESNNFYAQQIFKTIGAKIYGKGSVYNSTLGILRFYQKIKVSTKNLNIADGCGLSTFNRITPLQLVAVLEYLNLNPRLSELKKTLPKAGMEGTLEGRLNGIPLIAKTGTLKGHSALSGYLATKTKKNLTFSILINHHYSSSWHIKDLEDQFIKILNNNT